MTAIYRLCSDAFVHSGAAGARAGGGLIASRTVAMGRQLRCDGWRPWMEGDLVKARERGSALFASAQPVETSAPHQMSDKKGNSTDAR